MLEAGMKAPEFALPDQNGKVHTLEEYKGKKVILYFYPRDNTPGCTKQACGFGELYPEFSEKGAVVLGVSKDSVASHKKFEEKYGLPFTLLSDTELTCIQAYDVWKEKNMYGKKTMGVVHNVSIRQFISYFLYSYKNSSILPLYSQFCDTARYLTSFYIL